MIIGINPDIPFAKLINALSDINDIYLTGSRRVGIHSGDWDWYTPWSLSAQRLLEDYGFIKLRGEYKVEDCLAIGIYNKENTDIQLISPRVMPLKNKIQQFFIDNSELNQFPKETRAFIWQLLVKFNGE